MYGKRLIGTVGVFLMLLAIAGGLGGCAGREKLKEASAPKPTKEQQQKVDLLNQTAEGMYQKWLKGDVEGTRTSLSQLSAQVTGIPFEGITSVEGLQALTTSITDAGRVFAAVKFDRNAGQVATAQVRLAADALSHSNQPLWLQYYKPLNEDIGELERAAQDRSKTGLQKAVNRLEQHYGVIRPSLLISRQPPDVERMDSLLTFIKNQAAHAADPFRNVNNALTPLRQVVDKLFMKRETTAYLPYADQQNPILWTLILGSIILVALGFAGWRLSQKDGGLVPVRRTDETL